MLVAFIIVGYSALSLVVVYGWRRWLFVVAWCVVLSFASFLDAFVVVVRCC